MPQMPSSHTAGLRFVKLDLHIHTPASKCFADKSVTAAQIVKAAADAGLAGIAVTDHNSGAMVDELKSAAGNKLVIFPGCEVSCLGGKQGIHIVALFDPKCTRADVEGLLSELGLQSSDFGNSDSIVEKDPASVAAVIRKRAGLVVLAHSNSTKGVLNDMSGQQRIKLIQNLDICAAEGTDFDNAEQKQKHRRVVDLLDGTDPGLKRKLAVYQASDNPLPTDSGRHGLEGIGTRCAYFKLDRINLEGIHQCFADPEVRIKQDFELSENQYPRIKKVSIKGGFFDGDEAVFHPGLNSILGAKGAGKSLLVEFMRFALNQSPTNEDIKKDHEGKLQERLQQYGTVEIAVSDEANQEITVSRILNPAEDNPYSPELQYDIAQFFPVLFLSQGEIIKIAENPAEQIAFIDRFFDFRAYQQEIAQYEAELSSLDAELAEGFRAYILARELDKSISNATGELSRLDENLKDPIFNEYTKLEVKDSALRQQGNFFTQLAQKLKTGRKEVSSVPVPQISADMGRDPELRRMADLVAEANKATAASFDALEDQLSVLFKKAQAEYQAWSPAFLEGKKKYEQAVQSSGGDYKILAQRRAVKFKEIEQLNQRLQTAKEKSGRVKDIGQRRNQVLSNLQGAYQRYTQERRDKCKKIETESGGRITITLKESSNVDEFRSKLMMLKKGSGFREADIDRLATKIAPNTFIKSIVNFGLSNKDSHLDALAKAAGIELHRVRTLAEFLLSDLKWEDLLGLEYQAVPADQPDIRFRVAENTYEPLGKLSVGQKCTAMLIIALGDRNMPIVIDQPEDSLDIRSVWEDICSKIRRGKEKRQFIFTTHNSSLAVASDSDKFLIIEGGADKGHVVSSGSMDHRPLSDEVLKYLEGGVPTYRRKYDKYKGDELLRQE